MADLNSIKQLANRLWQIVLPLGGQFAGSEIKFTPIPEDVLNKSAAEIFIHPSPFPKLGSDKPA